MTVIAAPSLLENKRRWSEQFANARTHFLQSLQRGVPKVLGTINDTAEPQLATSESFSATPDQSSPPSSQLAGEVRTY